MTLKVVYTTNVRLSCISVTPTPTVILCLTDSALLAPRLCPAGGDMPYDFTTLEATLNKSWKSVNSCNYVTYSYVFAYDETLLADPLTPLLASQISGIFCEGCLTTWVAEEVGNEISVVDNGNGTFTLTSQHGCDTIISTGGVACVADSVTIDFDIDGGNCVTGDVNISSDIGNSLSEHADGLYASSSPLPNPITDGPDGLGGVTSVDWQNRQLVDSNAFIVVDWEQKTLYDGFGLRTIGWDGKNLYDTTGTAVVQWAQGTSYLFFIPNTAVASQISLAPSAAVNVVAPTSGDLWWNGTNLYFFDGATNIDLLAAGSLTTITADVGGTTTGTPVTLTGAGGITTTRALDVITIDGSAITNFWTQAAGTLFPTTATDRVLIGGAVDDTTSILQVLGDVLIDGKLTVTGAIDPTWIELVQQVTPPNPPALSDKLYFKSDDNLYKLDSAGNEVLIGGGGNFWSRDIINGYLFPTTLTDTVGIGTNTPTSILDIFSASDVDLTLSGTAAGASAVRYNDGLTAVWRVGRGSNDGSRNFTFYNDLRTVADIFISDTTGFVGIGNNLVVPTELLTVNGTLGLIDAISTFHTIFQAGDQSVFAANITYTLPINPGIAGDFLQTDGTGILTWAAAGAGTLTTITADAGGTTTGTPVTLTGSGGIVTSRAGDVVTIDGSALTNFWSQAASTLFPTTATDRILLGGAVDDTTSILQVLGDTIIDGKLTVTGAIDPTWIELVQQVTPANPPALSDKLYFKSDDNLYRLDSAGNENLISGGVLPNPITDGVNGIGGVTSVDWQNRQLVDSAGNPTIFYDSAQLFDAAAVESINWDLRELITSTSTISVDWENRVLNTVGAVPSLNWGTFTTVDSSSFGSIEWDTRQLLDTAGVAAIQWGQAAYYFTIGANTTTATQINLTPSAAVDVAAPNSGDLWWNATNLYFFDGTTNIDLLAGGGSLPNPITDGPGGIGGVTSVDWQNRQLVDDAGVIALQWQSTNRLLYDSTGVIAVDWRNRSLVDTTSTVIASWGQALNNFQLAANTTIISQLNLVSSTGVDVAAPVSGDLWYNGTNLFFYNGAINIDLLNATNFWSRTGSVVFPTTLTDQVTIGGLTAAQTTFNVFSAGSPIGFGNNFINAVFLEDNTDFTGVSLGYDSVAQIGVIFSQGTPGGAGSGLRFITYDGPNVTPFTNLEMDGDTHISTVFGSLAFFDPVSTFRTTFTAGDQSIQASDLPYVLPIAAGAAGTFLTNDGLGNLSWGGLGNGAPVSMFVNIGGTNTAYIRLGGSFLQDATGIFGAFHLVTDSTVQEMALAGAGDFSAQGFSIDAAGLIHVNLAGDYATWVVDGIGTAPTITGQIFTAGNFATGTFFNMALGAIGTVGADFTVDQNIDAATYSVGGTPGISPTIVTAQLTGGGAQGSMTFVNGILTAQTQAT